MQFKHPEIFTQFLANMLIIAILVGFIVLLTLLYQKRKIQQKREVEQIKAEIEKELLTTRLEIQEDIQRLFSSEIHDNVGQSLLLVNVNFTILLKQLNEDPNAVSLIKESKELLTRSMENLTSLSRSMNPDRIVEMGVFKAITEELRQLSDKKLFEITIHIPHIFQDPIQLKPDLQLVIFRIYQESVKNIIKYAEATKIKFEVKEYENELFISIIDNGKGFETTDLSSVTGIGLRNMQKRLAIFGGNVTVQSTINEGTCIQLIVPYNKLDKE